MNLLKTNRLHEKFIVNMTHFKKITFKFVAQALLLVKETSRNCYAKS